jgi:DNA gyrase subunit A
MVNKSRLVESIAELVNEKRIEGISFIRDESDREGMRVVVELKRDANPQVVLNQLFQYTQMEETFSINLLALVNNQPRVLTLREAIDHYISFQREVIERRTRYDLKKAEERAHILEGLKIACDNIDEVIRIIRESYNNAKTRLMEHFQLSEIQAQAILDMRLGRLQGLEREKIENELNALRAKISEYQEILASEKIMLDIVKQELLAIRSRYGDERRTEISAVEDEIDIEDLIPVEECVYTLTHLGYIKRLPSSTYRAQRRGGRGITAMTTREEDFLETIFTASTHDFILFFTNYGRVYRLKGYMIPETSRTAKGMNIINLLQIDSGEKVTAMIPVKEFESDKYLILSTKQGTIKRMDLTALHTARKAGVRAITLREDDELIGVRMTGGTANIILATASGRAIRFCEAEVRTMGREASGVIGIRLPMTIMS